MKKKKRKKKKKRRRRRKKKNNKKNNKKKKKKRRRRRRRRKKKVKKKEKKKKKKKKKQKDGRCIRLSGKPCNCSKQLSSRPRDSETNYYEMRKVERITIRNTSQKNETTQSNNKKEK
jgi:hypothetical protein